MKVVLTQEQYESMLNDFILKELYKKRIDEAIEYMEDNSKISLDDCVSITNFYKQLLDILKGVDKE